MDSMKNLLEAVNAEASPGATEVDIDAFEGQTGLVLPESLHALYIQSDGAVLSEGEMKILPLATIQEQMVGVHRWGFLELWGYFPFTDNNDSNPFCVCCNAPLTGYIVQVPHDDTAAIKFRSLGSFLAALQQFVDEDYWDLHEMPSEFEGPDRTAQDIAVGRELLKMAPKMDELEQRDALRFGMWLLSEPQVSEITPLLEHRDEYVRDDAARRLAAMQSSEASQALDKAKNEMRQFVQQCAERLMQAGIKATVIKEINLRLEPGPVWLNMEGLYSRRNDADVYDFILERSHFLLAQKVRK